MKQKKKDILIYRTIQGLHSSAILKMKSGQLLRLGEGKNFAATG
jgi:hypothetical protein